MPGEAGTEIVLRRAFETCLAMYPMVEYKKIFSKIAGLNEFNETNRRLQRNFFRGNAIVELDGNGRILIPRPMLKYGQLEKDVILVGMGNRVEIWHPELYEQALIQDPLEFSKMAEKILDEK
jgi:MraZ protein